MKEKSTFSKVWNIVSTVLVVIVVIFAVFLLGSRLIGLRVFNVVSGSMEPTYSVGDLVYVKEVDPEDITKDAKSPVKKGEPITFVLDQSLAVATHRVVSIDYEKQLIYTKGDANKDADRQPVSFKNVIGTPVFSLPLLGYVADFVQNPPGTYITIAIGVLLIIAVFLPDMLKKKPSEGGEAKASVAGAASEEQVKSDDTEEMRKELEALRAKLEAKEKAENTAEEAPSESSNE